MRLATMLLSVALLAGCALMPSTGVRLLTGSPVDGCFLANATGMLVADATYGTAIVDMGGMVASGEGPVAVAWRPGFTGRGVGGEIEVLDPDGHVVATTGQRYLLEGGYADMGGTRAFWSCGAVNPL